MNIKLDGFLIGKTISGKKYSVCDFGIGDIFIKRKNRWLKEDSVDKSRFFSNIQILKSDRVFNFYTIGTYQATNGGWGPNAQKNMLFEKAAAENKNFTLKIIASADKMNFIADCISCEVGQSRILPTVFGTYVQNIEIKYSDISLLQF